MATELPTSMEIKQSSSLTLAMYVSNICKSTLTSFTVECSSVVISLYFMRSVDLFWSHQDCSKNNENAYFVSAIDEAYFRKDFI